MSGSCTFTTCSPDNAWCLEMTHDHRSWTRILKQSQHIFHVWLLQHVIMTYYSCHWLTDNLLPYSCMGTICTSFASLDLLWMKELHNKSYLFSQTSTVKLLLCIQYITQTIIFQKHCSNSSGIYCDYKEFSIPANSTLSSHNNLRLLGHMLNLDSLSPLYKTAAIWCSNVRRIMRWMHLSWGDNLWWFCLTSLLIMIFWN